MIVGRTQRSVHCTMIGIEKVIIALLCLLLLLLVTKKSACYIAKRTSIEIDYPIVKTGGYVTPSTQQEDIIEEITGKIIVYEDERLSGLNSYDGIYYGPSGLEKYYNLPMLNVVNNMRSLGFSESEYPYYIRRDGVKMLGDYVIVAADLNRYPRGSVIETSLGEAIVCDTGVFVNEDPNIIDVAVNW